MKFDRWFDFFCTSDKIERFAQEFCDEECRKYYPPQTGKFKNLTLRNLPDLIENEQLKKEVGLGLDMIVLKVVDFAREWRMKIYAHRDYDIQMGRVSMQENASKEKIELALKSIRDLMDKVTIHYENSRTVYQSDAFRGGSRSLLHVIQDGLNCREFIKKRKYAGEEVDPVLKSHRITYIERKLDI